MPLIQGRGTDADTDAARLIIKTILEVITMALEIFINTKNPDMPSVTIRKNGTMSFNSLATKQLLVQDRRFAALYYDIDEQTIGIELKKDNLDKAAFAISLEKGKIPAISCQGFLRHYGIPYKERSRAYPLHLNKQNNMIMVKLS